jgi:hypothetical protein
MVSTLCCGFKHLLVGVLGVKLTAALPVLRSSPRHITCQLEEYVVHPLSTRSGWTCLVHAQHA